MAELDTAPMSHGSTPQAHLDTIPISPANENENPKSSEAKDTNGAENSADKPVTVFHDRDNFNVKHPLMHEWTLWFTKPPSGKASLNNFTEFLSCRVLTCNRGTTGMIY